MGIKDLNQLLKKICGSSYISHVPICNFAGKKIAIDALLYICIFKIRGPNHYIPSIIEFLTLLRENRIHPFFVFDGEAPVEKQNERSSRSERRAHQRAKLNEIKKDFESYKETNELSDLLKSLDFKTRRLAPTKVSTQSIQEYIDKIEAQIVSVTSEDFTIMKTLLDIFGINYITADSEGEFLCAALNRHGIVDAVMSADTDVLPCLAPTTINKIIDSTYFQVVYLCDILKELKLDEKQFIDFCIMCGTDFNKNIPKIGPVGAYEMILRYNTIDKLPIDLDVTILNHQRVREIFSYTDKKPEIQVPYCRPIDYEHLANYVSDVQNIKKRINKFIKRE